MCLQQQYIDRVWVGGRAVTRWFIYSPPPALIFVFVFVWLCICSYILLLLHWMPSYCPNELFVTFETFDQSARRHNLTNQNKLASLEAMLVWNSAHPVTEWPVWSVAGATSVAKTKTKTRISSTLLLHWRLSYWPNELFLRVQKKDNSIEIVFILFSIEYSCKVLVIQRMIRCTATRHWDIVDRMTVISQLVAAPVKIALYLHQNAYPYNVIFRGWMYAR